MKPSQHAADQSVLLRGERHRERAEVKLYHYSVLHKIDT